MTNARARFAAALATAALGLGLSATAAFAQSTTPAFGDLLKMPNDNNPATTADAAVYYFGADGKRYVFPNEKTYKTWYPDYSAVKVTSFDQLSGMPIGGNITYKPGSRLIKVPSSPKVYAVAKNGILRQIGNEMVAMQLYGPTWRKMIDDVPETFFANYKIGGTISKASDYNRNGIAAASPSISTDKLLTNPPAGYVDVRSTTGFSPESITVAKGMAVTWVALDSSQPTVASSPLSGADIPGFQTTTLQMGQSWSFTFTQPGTYGYKDNNYPDHRGTVIVTP